jgi:transcriptional regulator with XRE-family HTH domain
MNSKNTEMNKPIFVKIKDARESIGKTQDEVCEEIGISRNSYFLIEKGKTKNLSIDFGKKISKVLGVSFNELFEVENPELEKAKAEIKTLQEENEKLYKQEDFFLELTRMRRALNKTVYNQLTSILKKINESSNYSLEEVKESISKIIKSINDLEGFEQLEKELESRKVERLKKRQNKAT